MLDVGGTTILPDGNTLKVGGVTTILGEVGSAGGDTTKDVGMIEEVGKIGVFEVVEMVTGVVGELTIVCDMTVVV